MLVNPRRGEREERGREKGGREKGGERERGGEGNIKYGLFSASCRL